MATSWEFLHASWAATAGGGEAPIDVGAASLWGIADDNTWLSELSSGRKDFPLLFDGTSSHNPKKAFWAVVDF